MTVWIDNDLCDTCGRCIKICPYDAIMSQDGNLKIIDRCTECYFCIDICKNNAVLTNSKPKNTPNFTEYKNVWVFVEQGIYGIRTVSKEILNKAQKLAKTLKQRVIAVILGYGISKLLPSLKNMGVDEVIVVDNKILKYYDAVSYSSIIKDIIKSRKPNIFLFGATYIGRDLAPRVAQLVVAGLTADCTELTIDPEENILVQTRPAFGGNILATIVNRYSRPQMATVRPGVITEAISNERKDTKIEFLSCNIKHNSTKLLDTVIESDFHVKLSKAKTIIAGGRGMRNADNFKILYKLASTLKGEVAGTRVAVENGWISEKNQIGQTGQTVRPNLYIACGISGAIQHRAGIMDSKFIVAINKDPYAAIFKIANWGIIGDVFEILPRLIEYIQTKQKNKD